jgi:hypothetical protein
MNKREIASGLIKLANTLDNMGLMEEANIVDMVAKKIVVSKNPVIIRLQKGEAQSLVPSGDYPTDIANYKRLYYSGYYDARGDYNEKGFSNYLTLARDFLLKALQLYKDNPRKQLVFQNQAERIRTDIQNDYVDVNVEMTRDSKPLNYYLKKYELVDDLGNRKESINNINTFNARWNNLLNDPAISNKLDDSNVRSQLRNTKNILKENIPR